MKTPTMLHNDKLTVNQIILVLQSDIDDHKQARDEATKAGDFTLSVAHGSIINYLGSLLAWLDSNDY